MKSSFKSIYTFGKNTDPVFLLREKKSGKTKWLLTLGLPVLFLISLIWVIQGCSTQIPSVSSMNYKSKACSPFIFDSFESVTELDNFNNKVDGNGTTSGGNGSPVTSVSAGVTVVYSLSPLHVTHGNYSLDIDILAAPMTNGMVNNWDDRIWVDADSNISNVNWSDYSALVADFYIDPSVIAGASYKQLELMAEPVTGTYYYPTAICSSQPTISAGQQSVTWGIDFSAGTITAGSTLKEIVFILNANTNNGTGNIFIDNLRLVYKTCPTPTP